MVFNLFMRTCLDVLTMYCTYMYVHVHVHVHVHCVCTAISSLHVTTQPLTTIREREEMSIGID